MLRRLGSICAALACVVAAGTGLVACSSDDDAEATLEAFLAGWRDGNLDALAFIAPTGEKIAATEVATQLRELSGELKDRPPALSAAGDPKRTGEISEFPVKADWTLPGGVRWAYQTTVRLSPRDDDWRVIWEPTVVHPALTGGDALVVERLTGGRGDILDAAGRPIVTARPVVVIGVQPDAVPDVAALVKALNSAFRKIRTRVDLADLPKRLTEAKPGAFVEIVTLRREDYLRIRADVQPLEGTRFREEQRELAPSRQFARALLGSVDPVQRADLQARPDVYEIGDQAGHGGLQGRYEDRLRGAAGQRVLISRDTPDDTAAGAGDTEIFRAEARPGMPVKTTLNQRVQRVADAALAGERRQSALVAVRVSDSAVLAAANGPDGGGDNIAFTAQVPPGSTFKVVSALGLLDAGAVAVDTLVPCPKTSTVDGRTFTNDDGFALGAVPFRTDFARSCNTAFVALAPKLGADGLARAGAGLGLGVNWDLGADVFSGRVSTGGSAAERAAAAFGQGETVVSPLAMAGATAAVAGGRWQQPSVVIDPPPARPAPDREPLKATSVQALQTMMREVVTVGTGTALKDVPGLPVHGKTGTAEFDDNPANTHAWFVGWQGDVAFAVLVLRGGDGVDTAVPIAERFLRGLGRA